MQTSTSMGLRTGLGVAAGASGGSLNADELSDPHPDASDNEIRASSRTNMTPVLITGTIQRSDDSTPHIVDNGDTAIQTALNGGETTKETRGTGGTDCSVARFTFVAGMAQAVEQVDYIRATHLPLGECNAPVDCAVA